MEFLRRNQIYLFIFCCFLIKPIFALPSTNHQFLIKEKNVRVIKGIIETKQVKSIAECAVMCARTTGCNGFNYGVDSNITSKLCESLEVIFEIKASVVSSGPNFSYYSLIKNTVDKTTTKITMATRPTRPTTTTTHASITESKKENWKVFYTGDYKVVPSTQCDSYDCLEMMGSWDKGEKVCASNFGLGFAILNNNNRQNYVATLVAENTNCPPYCLYWIGMSGNAKYGPQTKDGKYTYVYSWNWRGSIDTNYQIWDIGQPISALGGHYVYLNLTSLLWGSTINNDLKISYICSSNTGL